MSLIIIMHSVAVVLTWADIAYVVRHKLCRSPFECNCRRERHFNRGERGHSEAMRSHGKLTVRHIRKSLVDHSHQIYATSAFRSVANPLISIGLCGDAFQKQAYADPHSLIYKKTHLYNERRSNAGVSMQEPNAVNMNQCLFTPSLVFWVCCR